MTEEIDPIRLLASPPARRLWLLQEAVRSVSFDRAIELARIADAFVTGSAADASTHEAAPPATTPSENPEQAEEIVPVRAAVPADPPTERDGMALPDDARDRLLDRLANGARNVELAAEFGISAKQVQGLRMGCAREIARRRTGLGSTFDDSADPPHDATETAATDEIVRYLRQQDDVVVLEETGGYLVNGRFRMSAAELVARANRMRSRQRKPAFQIPNGRSHLGSFAPSRHPLFREEP